MVTRYRVDRDTFSAGKPRTWAENFPNPSNYYRMFDLAADRKRFIHLRPSIDARENAASETTVLLNFFDDLRRRSPTRR